MTKCPFFSTLRDPHNRTSICVWIDRLTRHGTRANSSNVQLSLSLDAHPRQRLPCRRRPTRHGDASFPRRSIGIGRQADPARAARGRGVVLGDRTEVARSPGPVTRRRPPVRPGLTRSLNVRRGRRRWVSTSPKRKRVNSQSIHSPALRACKFGRGRPFGAGTMGALRSSWG